LLKTLAFVTIGFLKPTNHPLALEQAVAPSIQETALHQLGRGSFHNE
jgi:hypothetical protein